MKEIDFPRFPRLRQEIMLDLCAGSIRTGLGSFFTHLSPTLVHTLIYSCFDLRVGEDRGGKPNDNLRFEKPQLENFHADSLPR